MKKTNNTFFLGLYVTGDIKRSLEKIAKAEHRSLSGMVRTIVEQYLNKQKPK
jgi:predicted transcriptional regulator